MPNIQVKWQNQHVNIKPPGSTVSPGCTCSACGMEAVERLTKIKEKSSKEIIYTLILKLFPRIPKSIISKESNY